MGQREAKGPTTVTREELYEQVWRTPMSRLGAEYGISGNGLAKICARLNIPCPPRGYWAKKAAGTKVVTYRLPEAEEGTPATVTIVPTPSPAGPTEVPAEVREKINAARSSAQVKVPDRLRRPHPVIAAWLAERERRKQAARQEREPWLRKLRDPGALTPTERRRHLILDTLFKALERQGAKVKEGDHRELIVEVLGEGIEFQLREKQKRVRRPLTAEERRWRSAGDRDTKQELQPSGRLVLAIKTYLFPGLRTEWLETDGQPMEALLPDIVATFIAAVPLLVERRKQREEEARLRHIEELKRYEEEKRLKCDDSRWLRFVDIAKQWRKPSSRVGSWTR